METLMILIVGGAGYIGSHTNKMLNQNGYETVVFDNLSTGHRDFVKWGEFFEGDLANIDDLRNCFKKYKIDAVMHFSALISVGESVIRPDIYYQNNVVNTINLLNVMNEFDVKHFIFSSTAAIFGYPDTCPIVEDHPYQPINPYGKSKLMIEQILEDYDRAFDLKYICLRYFNASGADPDGEIGEKHDPENHLVPLTIFAAQGKRESIKIFGTEYPTKDGTCVRDYIHVNDLADAHIKGIQYLQNTNTSNCFNLGNGEGYSVQEIVDIVKKVSQINFKVDHADIREGDPPTLISSSDKAKEILGWKPNFNDIDTIVQTAWNWHNSN